MNAADSLLKNLMNVQDIKTDAISETLITLSHKKD